jgi:hypothetical protein
LPEVIPPAPPDTIPQPDLQPPALDELTIRSASVIGIRLDAMVSSRTAQVEDRVTARVSRDVTVEGRVAIPTGAQLEGTVTAVTRGGRFKERARIGLRFSTLVLPDRTRLTIDTETVYREGDPPGGEATAKIGASAVVGALLGSVIGGKKGAAIGGAAGAAGGTAAVAAGGPNDAILAAGTPLTVRLAAPVVVLVDREAPSVP